MGSKLAFRVGLLPVWYSINDMGSHCMGDVRYSHGISVKDGSVIPKLMPRLALLFPAPHQSYEFATYRMKRGGVGFIVASHILRASLV